MKKYCLLFVLLVFVFTTFLVPSLNIYANTEEVIYLSDLEGITNETLGSTDGINQDVEGGTLVVNDVVYEKGFSSHPISGDTPSEIIVDISQYSNDYPILHMIVGKDDSAAGGGTDHPFIFGIMVDGEEVYLSDPLNYGEQEEVFLNIVGAQEVSLLCYAAGPFAWLTTNFVDVYLCDLEVKEVRLSKTPLKTEYIVGEKLSVTGGTLEVVYENDFVTSVDISESMVSGFDYSVEGEQEITITYNETTFTYTVNVVAQEATATPEATPNATNTVKPTNTTTQEPSSTTPKEGNSALVIVIVAIAVVAIAVVVFIIIKKRKQ